MDGEERSQQERALDAVAAINAGADPAAEAFALANDYTDGLTARLGRWLRGSRGDADRDRP